jgi:hypothetical protein
MPRWYGTDRRENKKFKVGIELATFRFVVKCFSGYQWEMEAPGCFWTLLKLIKLHGVISRKINIWNIKAVRTTSCPGNRSLDDVHMSVTMASMNGHKAKWWGGHTAWFSTFARSSAPGITANTLHANSYGIRGRDEVSCCMWGSDSWRLGR